VAQEAERLADWWALLHGETDEARRAAKAAELSAYLAYDGPQRFRQDEDPAVEEVFVEVKTVRFLAALDLPLPDELQDIGG
jgi:hypothetical protein